MRVGLFALVVLFSVCAFGLRPAGLVVRWNPDDTGVSAPNLHFLSGKQLDRLHDGATVPFDFQLTLFAQTSNEPLRRMLDRFAISYDLWEEKFSVTRTRAPRKSVSHLSAAAAETWCVDNMLMPSPELPAGRDLWLRLEVRSVEPRDFTPALSDGPISLATLIEIFSRPSVARQQQWTLDSAQFRVSDFTR